MAMMKCAECGAEVSTAAQACPKCGFPVGATRIRVGHILLLVVLGAVVGAVLVAKVGWLTGLFALVAIPVVGSVVFSRRNIN